MQYQNQEDLSLEYELRSLNTDQVSVGNSVIGLPIVQYQIQQGTPQYQLQEFNTRQTHNRRDIIAQQMYPLRSKELKLISNTTYFKCCNCCLGVLVFIYLLLRCFTIFDLKGIRMAFNVVLIISDCVFVFAVILGLYAINKQQENLLVQYQVLLGVSCQFDLVAQISEIIIRDLPHKYNGVVIPPVHVKIISIIICVIFLVFFYGMLMKWAGRISTLISELRQLRNQLENQQQAQQAINNLLQQQETI